MVNFPRPSHFRHTSSLGGRCVGVKGSMSLDNQFFFTSSLIHFQARSKPELGTVSPSLFSLLIPKVFINKLGLAVPSSGLYLA